MKAVKWQRAVSLFLCLLMAMSFFVVTAPNAYADEGDTTGVTWPQLKEKGGLTFKDDNGDNKLVSNAYNYSTNNEGFTFTSKDVTISNYTELVSGVPGQKETATKRVYQVGEIVLNYGDALLAAPTSNFSLIPRNNCVFKAVKDADNSVINALNGAATLNSGEYYMRVFVVTDKENPKLKYHYYYHLKIVGSNLLAHYPDTWTADEIGPNFEFSSAEYIDSYTSWGLTSQIIPTWGTTLSKDKLDFTNGHDTFTLTNLAGKSQEYTVTLKMPWQFKIPPLPGYNVAVLSAGNVPLCENQTLTTPSDRIDKEIKSGQWVTMSVKPTGENKNMVIKTVTLTKSRDNETIPAKDIKISGNTFTFKMPDDCVTVTAITFKEDPSPSYDISASATKYRNEIGYAMGTVTVTDGETPIASAHAGNEVTVKATPVEHAAYDFQFVGWDTKDVALTDDQKTADTITFEMPAKAVSLTAVFEKRGAKLSFSASPENALSSVDLVSMTKGNYMTFFTSHEDIVKPGAAIAVRPTGTSQFVLESYEVKDQADASIDYVVGDFGGCQFTVPENATSISVVAKYRSKKFSTITVSSNETAWGSAAATVEGEPVGAAVIEGTTVTVTATAKFRYKFKDWTAAYKDGSQVDFELTPSEENPNVATFTVPTSGKEIVITANFERDETQNSNKCEITSVGLYNGEKKIGTVSKSGLNYTITLPADTDTTDLADMILKLTISEFATVTKENDPDKNWVEGAPCGMALDTQTKFTVTAEDGTTTNVYTITIKKAAAPNAPTLSGGSAARSSKTAATVKFTTNEAGTYYYKVVNHGATAPTVDTTKNGTAAVKGENTISLTNLTEEARDIYIVVVSAAGGKSAPLKVEIPAYGSDVPDTGAYKISVSTPKGGTITTSRTKADAGVEIIVTVIPDDGYQMVAGSLRYGFADGGAPMDKVITNNRFTMPAGDINITCDWETATTTAKGITSFSINGVAGAVNNTTNTITITMPRGTDVTKLTPVIATSGVKSLTPGSGVTMDFTNAVTYTATMDDGSTKTYTVTVYVDKGTLADQFWDKLTDFATQVPWWEYAKHQQSTSKYPKYW